MSDEKKIKILLGALDDIKDTANRMTTGNIGHGRGTILAIVSDVTQLVTNKNLL